MGNIIKLCCCCCCKCCKGNERRVEIFDERNIRKAFRSMNKKSPTLVRLMEDAINYIKTIKDGTLLENASLVIYDGFDDYACIAGDGRFRIVCNMVLGKADIRVPNGSQSYQNGQITE